MGDKAKPKVLYLTNRNLLYPIVQFATWHMNGVCVPASSSASVPELEYQVANSKADLVVCLPEHHAKFEKIADTLKIPTLLVTDKDTEATKTKSSSS